MSEVHTYIETLKKIGINGIQIIQDGQEIGCFMKKEYKRQNQYSITKSFTSAAVGFAIEEGLFELNSKVCQLFDEAIKIEDESKAIRKSHENPYIKKLYNEYFKEPMSHQAHELLHTKYFKKHKI